MVACNYLYELAQGGTDHTLKDDAGAGRAVIIREQGERRVVAGVKRFRIVQQRIRVQDWATADLRGSPARSFDSDVVVRAAVAPAPFSGLKAWQHGEEDCTNRSAVHLRRLVRATVHHLGPVPDPHVLHPGGHTVKPEELRPDEAWLIRAWDKWGSLAIPAHKAAIGGVLVAGVMSVPRAARFVPLAPSFLAAFAFFAFPTLPVHPTRGPARPD